MLSTVCSMAGEKFADCLLRLSLFPFVKAPDRPVSQLAANRCGEPREPVLHDVVGGTGLDRGDGSVFADRARDDDAGRGVLPAFENFESAERVEMRHRKVGQNDVPLVRERGGEVFGRLDPFPFRLEPASAKLAQDELRVIGVVLEDHSTAGRAGGQDRAGGCSSDHQPVQAELLTASTNLAKSTGFRT